MAKPYKLRFSLVGHSMDVRTVAPARYPDGAIVTGSRDRTTRVWTPNEFDAGFTEGHCMVGPTNFVSSICTLVASEQHPYGLILVGSNDCAIYCFTLDSPKPVYKLHGHSGTVCALAAGKFGTVLSGSWDQTARVWLGQKCMMVLEGHAAAVWAVHVLPEQGLMLTGSADKTIRLWRAGKCEKVFTGHEDCVRGLAVISTREFLSCSNDASVRHWQITGECMKVYHGHTNFVYGIAVLPDNDEFVTCGEDRTVRVWKDGECHQTIFLPAQSVWAVTCLPNGDIVAGCSDGTARVFTMHPELFAPPEEQKAYEELVSKNTLPAGEIGDLKISELPGVEALYEPGARDGQTKLVRHQDHVVAHQWSAAEGCWLKIGDVVGASGSTQSTSGKVLFEGQEYDYVFSVDIEGDNPLKLPYNITEDPWHAAQKFIYKHNLNQLFLDQIANFIITNTKGMALGQSSPTESDPFTGGCRYLPATLTSTSSSDSNSASDPFTGSGRYLPNENPVQSSTTVANKTDDTCGDSQQRSAVTVNSNIGDSFFPQTHYLKFDMANVDGIVSKLQEFNCKVPTEHRVTSDEIDDVVKLVGASESLEPSDQQMATLEKLINWPKDMVFPALDLLRLAVRGQHANRRVSEVGGIQLTNHLLSYLTTNSPASNKMLSLRTLCNLFIHPSGETLTLAHRDRILSATLDCTTCNKNIQVAVATLLLNYAVAYHKQPDIEGKSQCLSAITTFLQCLTEAEARFRLLVGLGTIIWGDPQATAFAKALDLLPIVKNLTDITEPLKIGKCAQTLGAALK